MQQKTLLDIAKEEVSVSSYAKFAPIVRGPLFALLMIMALGVIAIPYMLYRKINTRIMRLKKS